jgi:hypothetical protein
MEDTGQILVLSLYLWEKSHRYPLDSRMGGPQNLFGLCGEETNLLPQPEVLGHRLHLRNVRHNHGVSFKPSLDEKTAQFSLLTYMYCGTQRTSQFRIVYVHQAYFILSLFLFSLRTYVVVAQFNYLTFTRAVTYSNINSRRNIIAAC